MAGIASVENGKKGGRPKGSKGANTLAAEAARDYILQRVTKELGPIIDKAIKQAKEGNQAARKDLFDRAFGKPRETLDLQMNDIILKLDI